MSKHVAQINNENKIISRWAFRKYHNSKVTEKRIERYCLRIRPNARDGIYTFAHFTCVCYCRVKWGKMGHFFD